MSCDITRPICCESYSGQSIPGLGYVEDELENELFDASAGELGTISLEVGEVVWSVTDRQHASAGGFLDAKNGIRSRLSDQETRLRFNSLLSSVRNRRAASIERNAALLTSLRQPRSSTQPTS